MNQHTQVRPAQRDDAAFLVACNTAMAQETEAVVLPQERLALGVAALFDEPRRGFYRIAECTGERVGCLLVTLEWSDWRHADFWWIQSVYVLPSARRQGVFRALYAHVEQAAQRAGAAGLRLYVERDNRAAQATYASLGMQPCHYVMFERGFG